MQDKEKHKIPSIETSVIHSPKVELLTTFQNPKNWHLSNCLDLYWLALKPGICTSNNARGLRSKQFARLALLSGWFSLESLLRLVFYMKFKDPSSDFFIDIDKRTDVQKILVSKGKDTQLGIDDLIEIFKYDNDCCDKLEKNKHKLIQISKLRNLLIHGYTYRSDQLLEQDQDDEVKEFVENGKTVRTTTYNIQDEELLDAGGNVIDTRKKFPDLKLQHQITDLCKHDILPSLSLIIFGLVWVDHHYGIGTQATWMVNQKQIVYTTRKPTIKNPNADICLYGQKQLINFIKNGLKESKRKELIKNQLHAAKQPKNKFKKYKNKKGKKK